MRIFEFDPLQDFKIEAKLFVKSERLEVFKAFVLNLSHFFELLVSALHKGLFSQEQVSPGASHENRNVLSRIRWRVVCRNNIWVCIVDILQYLGNVVSKCHR